MTVLEQLLALPRGARFYRADMHVHTFGGSHDVKDPTMTPENVIETALNHGLGVVAITDHNDITNVLPALKAAEKTELLVIPGVELSTPQGHLLAYLPTLQALEQFFGRLDIVERGTPNSHCQNGIVDCLKRLKELGGFAILAHVDANSGFEVSNQGGSPHKVDVICHAALLGIELKNAKCDISYADGDPDAIRVHMGKQRIERLGLGEKQFLARVQFSDSHALQQLGRNAAGDKKVTRVKMDTRSFDALRIALEDSDARIRIEDQVPVSVPHILGVRFVGGFLDKQMIHFSPNLNCIIGGRGTGKSTTFEAIGCLSGTPSDNGVIDSEVWPGELSLFWRDEAGRGHSLQRLTGGELTNLDDGNYGPVSFPVDCYGQGDTAKLGERAKNDPMALLDYLDGFMEINDAKAAEDAALEVLRELQEQLADAERKVAVIPQTTRDLSNTRAQLNAVEENRATEVIDLQRRLASEHEIRNRINEQWNETYKQMRSGELREKIEEISSIAAPAEVSVGSTEFHEITEAARALRDQVHVMLEQLGQCVFRLIAITQYGAWRSPISAHRDHRFRHGDHPFQ